MGKTTKDHVDALIEKAATARDSADAMRFSQAALNAANAASVPSLATELPDEVIKHMADRFLSWELPRDFRPDCGISFDKSKIHPSSWPTGTNLINATQATAMVRHMLDGLPVAS